MFRKLLYPFLIFAILLGAVCLSSCGGTVPEDTTEATETEPEQTEAPDEGREPFFIKSGKDACTVIRSIDADDKTIEIAVDLRKSLQKAFPDVNVNIGNDFVKPGTPHNSDKYEILVGLTDYEESKEVYESLGYLDYAVVLRGRKIVIIAKSDDRLKKAADTFLSMISSGKGIEENGDVTLVFEDKLAKTVYKADKMKINGHKISEYKIVYDKKSGLFNEAAENVRTLLANATGVLLDTVPDDTPATDCEIIVGPSSRLSNVPKLDSYEVRVEGSKLIFASAGPTGALTAARRLYADELYAGGDIDLTDGFKMSGVWAEDSEGMPRAEGTDLRIISFNILTEKWGGDATSPRAELLGVMLENYRPDAIGIQEVCEIWHRMIPYYCGDYKHICTTRPDGVTNYSTILYDSTKYDVVDSGVIPYSMTANVWCRNMGWAVFCDKSGKTVFGLISTHWDFDNAENDRSKYRKVQAEEISRQVAIMAGKYGCPVFTTGDYNCIQSSESMTYFRSINNMWCSKFDSKTYYNVYGSCTSLHSPVSPTGNSIDFVFGTKDTECLGNMIIVNCKTQDISDHRPVLADIRIKK
ncbi:MAG: hypothetical protein J6V01_03080 [Clostridia bacterium]|nr:hypothetical protein [Clostridia bacterium]